MQVAVCIHKMTGLSYENFTLERYSDTEWAITHWDSDIPVPTKTEIEEFWQANKDAIEREQAKPHKTEIDIKIALSQLDLYEAIANTYEEQQNIIINLETQQFSALEAVAELYEKQATLSLGVSL